MNQLVLHAVTEATVAAFLDNPSHAVLLHGPSGSGKRALGQHIGAQLLGIDPVKFDGYPYLHTIQPIAGKAIGIEAIRTLEHFLSHKVPRPGAVNRLVLIDAAETLGIEAQNALLKTLEEPPHGTVVILLASSWQTLLPTIRSRAQSIAVLKPPAAQLATHFISDGHTTAAVAQAAAMSGGLPGLMHALLTSSDHPLQPAVAVARQLLQQSTYQRLLLVDELSKQRAQAGQVVYILQQMAHARLSSAADKQFERWQRVLNASYQAAEQLAGNTQPKLVLDQLMLNLG